MPPFADRGPITAVHRRLDRLTPGPRRTVVLVLLAGWFTIVYLSLVWFSAVVFDRSRDWTGPIPGLLGGFLGSAGVIWLQRRRLGGRERMREYDRALRTGRLPDDADPVVWRPLLERERQAQRRAMGFSYGVVGVLGLCWVLVAVLYDVSPVWWPLAVLVLALFAAFLRWAGNRQARRIRRLLEQVPHAAAD